jgi:microcystin-dependent protein
MTDVFVGQVMLTPFSFAPRGFAQCDGALMAITQNQALFSLLGTVYGGDGQTTFQLPDLRGRTPYGIGNNYSLGQIGGQETVTLQSTQIPLHVHTAGYSTQSGAARNPNNALYGNTGSTSVYAPATGAQVTLNASTAGATGQSQPHSNLQPLSVLNFCIALSGIFPSRN